MLNSFPDSTFPITRNCTFLT